MIPSDLKNLGILVTRPQTQARELCEQIQLKQGEAIHFPTLDFAPPPDPFEFETSLQKLGEQDWLIFISPQSVYSSSTSIRRTWPELPSTVKLAAIGPGTAKALSERGFDVTLYPELEWNSQGLLNLAEFQSIKNKKIAIIRGLGGREKVDEMLAQRGATILSVIAYQRVLPDIDPGPILNLLKQHKIHVIICTSYESVLNLKILLGQEGWTSMVNIPMVVISDRIKMLAEDLGFRRIWVTSQSAIIDLLLVNKDKL